MKMFSVGEVTYTYSKSRERWECSSSDYHHNGGNCQKCHFSKKCNSITGFEMDEFLTSKYNKIESLKAIEEL